MKVDNMAYLPRYQTQGSSGFDFHALEDVELPPHATRLIRTGLAFSLPCNLELQIRSRSSLSLNHGVIVLNAPATIDSDYRGEVKIILHNISNEQFNIKHGDRIAQGVVSKIQRPFLLNVTDLDETERGDGGFGSTGLN